MIAILLAALFVSPRATATATDETAYLSEFEAEVLREHNLARTDPARYSRFVAAWLRYYDGNVRQLPGGLRINTVEGKRGVVRAVRFLEAQAPLPPLEPSAGLSRAARDHMIDTGRRGWMGHVGTDDSEPGDRVSRYGTWYGRVGENITYGGWTARELIIRLIIDDGIPDRGHRANIFNPEFRYAGVSFGSHLEYGSMCVITYAADFEDF